MSDKIIKTPNSKLWIDDDGIVHSKYINKIDVTLELAKEDIKNIAKLSDGRRIPIIVNMSQSRSITREAREYFSSEENAKVMAAAALVADSPLHKVMGNFFLRINKPPFPIKIFSSEEDAIDWLKTFLDD